MKDFIAGLPKCELHLHIEGTLEPELKFELARRNGLRLPYAGVEQMRAAYTFDSLPSFLRIYYEGMRVLRTEPDFYDLAMAYLRKAAEQNVRYAEIFFDPQAHTSRGVPFDLVIRGLRRALTEAEARLGVRAQLIMCFLRDFQAEYAMATLLESLPYREWIAGVGLDSDEKDNPPVKFAAVYERARQEGYLLTMHCDVDQDDAVEHIRQAVEDIGVNRIDHGVNILEDQRLVEVVLERGMGLTCCPISNGYVTDSMKAEGIRKLMDLGVRVTINSDDPAYFGAYVGENLEALQGALQLTRDELARLERDAFEIAWLPRHVKDAYLAEVDAYLARER
ncbi:adenosine deaminase [Nonomuraea sp. KC401]|uniref:adenosine deaminase n=1 Tax=unclassified Nonomuraea TaxID=2593643 RepID=UPI0010FD4408|nr:adenosine deaminase [Nonomuraea sp. KC401]NBE92077.1 adenosine deaminase [Nonomuraea sp. K271]TLF85121.1 adenosine deaminase [Nonomuraea sp. KC401]